ncbi:nitrate transporter [Epibacterium sp. SM1979]|uniref:Nitrate transporter n=1 Tax=Tritonibacter litoralis TaxID=2662264 RepID=A0A843YF51_9RHOB|nr:ABC transporter substrate-binding protein [Tritonibacter litoralis]MQQ10080.1 nitrate transporter [Tritonibacter litoralis]
MKARQVKIGFIPLLDVAPYVVAREIGFAEEEGLSFDMVKAPSWSTLRDWLAIGSVEAAHMLSPVPVVSALGLGGRQARFSALTVTSVNGNVLGASADLVARMQANGFENTFCDPHAVGAALQGAVDGKLRIGVPFPFSMHAELLYYWLSAIGLPAPQGLDVRTIPPPLMAEAMAAGEIEAFFVGEPWGSFAVERGLGSLLLPGRAIWQAAPEKVLAVRTPWAEENTDLAEALVRSLWRASRWLALPDNHGTATDILSRREYLDVPAEILERGLTGRIVVSPTGEMRQCDGFLHFYGGATGFPWRSQAAWIGQKIAQRVGLDVATARRTAAEVFRSDVYRHALEPLHVDLPGASEKLEGTMAVPTEVASASGTLILHPDQFFDGRVFDPFDAQEGHDPS